MNDIDEVSEGQLNERRMNDTWVTVFNQLMFNKLLVFKYKSE